MQSTETLDLEAIRERAENATPGPWTLEQSEWPEVLEPGGRWIVADWGEWMGPIKADRNAEFISHARSDVPALLTALAAERDRAYRAEAALAEAWDEGYDAGAGGEYHELGTNPYRSEAAA